jgi:pantothenate kinase
MYLFVCLFIYILFNQAPKNLMTLNEILEDYIRLKEQKETMDKEKANLEHEKNQIQLQMLHNATTTYNVSGFIPPHAAKSTLTDVSQPAIISNRSHPGTIL